MIDSLELSKSDRAKCKGCGKKIGIGTPRGVESSYHNNHPEYSYYCYKCLETKLELDKREGEMIIAKIQELKEELKKMIKGSQKAIILAEL